MPHPAVQKPGLYFHIPFCSQRCIYCDFYFVTTEPNHQPFVDAVSTELEHRRSLAADRLIETLYFGGGTPSLLSLEHVETILQKTGDLYDLGFLSEITFEVNPENAHPDYLAGLKDLGITRISLGVQSFFDDDLRFMRRVHNARESETAVWNCLNSGFNAVSIDLIFGVPGQSRERWLANLDRAIALEVDHISPYGLTVEPKTPLAHQVARGHIRPEHDETVRNRFVETILKLTDSGFEHYEVSNFARPGGRSTHNQIYWQHGNYIGFGPGAHSMFWSSPGSPAPAHRWNNDRNLRRYVEAGTTNRLIPCSEESLQMMDLSEEYIMLRLRLPQEGLDLSLLENHYGTDLLSEKMDEIADLEYNGFIRFRNNVIRLTTDGVLLADSITARLLPSHKPAT